MRVFWWQGGLHWEPETPQDSAALKTIAASIKLSDVSQRVEDGELTRNDCVNKQPILHVNKSLEVLKDVGSRFGASDDPLRTQDLDSFQAT
jgi:hypothetical protein